MSIQQIQLQIDIIGGNMVQCKNQCPSINRDQKNGILPRCLYFQTKKKRIRQDQPDEDLNLEKPVVVVVGLNPGESDSVEQGFYKNNSGLYVAVKDYMEHIIGIKQDPNIKNPFGGEDYYKKLLNFIKELGLDGPILWTESVKCESLYKGVLNQNGKTIKVKTPVEINAIRSCSFLFLNEEIKVLRNICDFIIIAASAENYRYLSVMYPGVSVVGIPHPTGSRGKSGFDKLFVQIPKVLDIRFKNLAIAAIKAKSAVYLKP